MRGSHSRRHAIEQMCCSLHIQMAQRHSSMVHIKPRHVFTNHVPVKNHSNTIAFDPHASTSSVRGSSEVYLLLKTRAILLVTASQSP